MNQVKFSRNIIAPCGMNCGICKAHLREKNRCPGCNDIGPSHPKTRVNCRLRLCEKRKGEFCRDCEEFPCDRLRRLDNRYRARYGISEIENLEYIGNHGIKKFIAAEVKKWIFDKGILCLHDKNYYK